MLEGSETMGMRFPRPAAAAGPLEDERWTTTNRGVIAP
jgi:hypothetical protein